MKDQLTYDETANQMTKYLLQNNITFKKIPRDVVRF